MPLIVGMEVILIPSFNPDKFVDLLNKYNPNHIAGVPSHYGNIIRNLKFQKSSLEYLLSPIVGDMPLILFVRDMECPRLLPQYVFVTRWKGTK